MWKPITYPAPYFRLMSHSFWDNLVMLQNSLRSHYSRVDITGGQPDLKEGGSLIKLVGESFDLMKSKLL